MFDGDAAVHDDEQAGVRGLLPDFLVSDSELHPDRAGPGSDCLVYWSWRVDRPSEEIDDVDGPSRSVTLATTGSPRITLPSCFALTGKNLVSDGLEISGDAVARPELIGREADDGDPLRPFEERPDLVVGLARSRQRAPTADDAGGEADQVHAAVEAGVLDLDAPVLDEIEPRLARDPAGLVALYPELNPEDFGADLDRLFGQTGHSSGLRKTSTMSTLNGISLNDA